MTFTCPRCHMSAGLDQAQNCPQCELRGQYVMMLEVPPEPPASGFAESLISAADVDLEGPRQRRLVRGLPQLMVALGDGLCPGSTYLVSGDPGIGKSTLATQLALGLVGRELPPALYVAAEEPEEAVAERVRRFAPGQRGLWERILIGNANELGVVGGMLEHLDEHDGCGLVVVDSIQVCFHRELQNPPGSVTQVLAVTNGLKALAREYDVPVWILAHVTKDGAVAGPKSLEHLVDVVTQVEVYEDDERQLVITKNRRGKLAGPVKFVLLDNGAWRER